MPTLISSAAQPIYGSGGLITGYTGTGGKKNNSTYQLPIVGSSGLITSYSTSGNTSTDTGSTSGDPTGEHTFDPVTGLNAKGLTKGQQAAKDYQSNTALVSTTKSQPIANAASETLAQEQQLNQGIVKSFSDYLNEAKQLQAAGAKQVATDTQTLNQAPAKLESGLSDTVKKFADTAAGINQQATALNDQNAQTVQSNIASLDKLNTDYETNARAAAGTAVANALARSRAAQSATGTPTSDSAYWDLQSANITNQYLQPVEAQISQNRIGQLINYVSPQEQQLYANRMSQLTGLQLPIAQQLVGFGITDANAVAQLAASLAGRGLNEQIQYLTSLGMPVQLAQSVAQGLPSALGQLSNLDQSNTYYGLAQDYTNPVANGLPSYSAPGYVSPVSYGYTPPGGNVNPNSGNLMPNFQPSAAPGLNQPQQAGYDSAGIPIYVNRGRYVYASGAPVYNLPRSNQTAPMIGPANNGDIGGYTIGDYNLAPNNLG